jgi:hypothetical protein
MSDTTNDLLPRVAVLEHIAKATLATLERLENRLDRLDARMADDFRFLVRLQITLTTVTAGLTLAGLAMLGGIMVHGFHWL